MKKYRAFIQSIMGTDYETPLSERLHAVILGSQDFVDEIKSNFLKDRSPDRELPDLKDLTERIGLAEIVKSVDRIVAPNEKLAWQVKLYFSHCYTRLKLKEIGGYYGISESGVTQASRRVRSRVEADKKFARMIKQIAKLVNV